MRIQIVILVIVLATGSLQAKKSKGSRMKALLEEEANPAAVRQKSGYALPQGFRVGRIASERFELNELNGRMTPDAAKAKCERNGQCAAFTFRGALTGHEDDTFDVYFFRFVMGVESEAAEWTSYQVVARSFVTVSGRPLLGGRSASKQDLQAVEELLERSGDWPKSLSKVVAVAYKRDAPRELGQTFVSFNLIDQKFTDEAWQTVLNLDAAKASVGDSQLLLSPCCKDVPDRVDDYFSAGNVRPVERLACDFDATDLVDRFVRQRKPAKLQGCAKKSSHLTLDDVVLNLNASLVGASVSVNEADGEERLQRIKLESTRDLSALRETGAQFKVQAVIGEEEGKRLELDAPAINIKDIASSRKMRIEAASEGMGSSLRVQSHASCLISTLHSGRKWWVILPRTSTSAPPTCSPTCTPPAGRAGGAREAVAWFQNILPQLLHSRWSGLGVVQTVQSAGETVYVPAGTPFATYVLQDALEVTETMLTPAAVDMPAEVAKGYDVERVIEELQDPSERRRLQAGMKQIRSRNV